MGKLGNWSKQHRLWYLAAMLAPVTQAASTTTWPGALVLGILAAVMGIWSKWGTGWVLVVQKLWAAVIAGGILQWSVFYWEGLPFAEIVPAIILALTMWTVTGKGKTECVGCVLLWPVLLLLGAVLLSGIPEVKGEYLLPNSRIGDVALLTFLVIPGTGRKGIEWRLPMAALMVSIITAGVLAPQVSIYAKSGILELSRSLSLLGVAERFESLVAAAMTMGFYAAVSYLLNDKERGSRSWGYAGIAALIWLLGIPINSLLLALGSVAVWVALPWLNFEKKFSEKGEKSS